MVLKFTATRAAAKRNPRTATGAGANLSAASSRRAIPIQLDMRL
jgi:hypothetical protein